MKRNLLILIALFAVVLTSFAQNPLPNDPAVRKGVLPNGMTYYIRHNDKPENRAEFYLATDVGAIQETPDQDGLAHFLEHMCFNGTKNFPGKDILNYLQSIGAEFGRNINASNGVEQTQYMLNNIPLVRPGVVDTCLLIIHDYSHYVLNEQEEIDSERGVILEEKRTRNSAGWRMHMKSLPYLYGDSKYSTCSLIGSEHNLKTFKRESLVNFYETWCRPDNQAVIVVGDINVDEVEAKLKSIFSDIPAPVNPKAKELHPIPGNVEPKIGIITDPEATSTSTTVMWKTPASPEELNSTDMGMVNNLIKAVIGGVMSERFNDIASKPAAPFMGASLGVGSLCATSDALYGGISSVDGGAIKAFKAFYYEALKMQKYGFSDGEIDRAKENLLKLYERAVEGASSRKNSEFISELMSNFYDGYPYMEPNVELEYAKSILGQLNAALLNQITPTLIPAENLVIIYKAPEKEGLVHPTEAEFLSAMKEVEAMEIVANEVENLNIPLLDTAALAGSKVKKEKETIHGATEWTLANGVKVVVLPTEYRKDQVMLQLDKTGGSSIIATEDLPSFDDNVWGIYLGNTGVADFPSTTLSKLLAGKSVGLSPYIGSSKHGMTASSTPKDIETALQLLYLFYTQPRFDKDEFQVGLDQIEAVLPNVVNQPSTILQNTVSSTLYGDNPRIQLLDENLLKNVSLETIERVYTQQLFKDAAGVEVYITGNVDLATLKPLIEKYIGSLPKGKKETKYIKRESNMVKGKVEKHFDVAMEAPKTTVIQLYSSYKPYSIERSVIMSAAKYIIDMIYTKTIREEEGGTYGVSVSASMSRKPKVRQLLQISFDTNEESYDKLKQKAIDELNKLILNGPTEEEMTRTIENFKKNLPESRISNSYWLSVLNYYYNNKKVDYDKEYEKIINDITPEKIVEVLEDIIEEGNFVEFVMSPKAK